MQIIVALMSGRSSWNMDLIIVIFLGILEEKHDSRTEDAILIPEYKIT